MFYILYLPSDPGTAPDHSKPAGKLAFLLLLEQLLFQAPGLSQGAANPTAAQGFSNRIPWAGNSASQDKNH